jgi:MFS family permease
MLYAPNINALVAAIAPRGRGVTYQAAISVTQDIGMAAGPASGLALSASIGARLMWLLALPLGTIAGAATARAATLRPTPDDPAAQEDAPPLVDTEA